MKTLFKFDLKRVFQVLSLATILFGVTDISWAANPETFSAPQTVPYQPVNPILTILTPSMYGAKCDSATDDSVALQNMENAAGLTPGAEIKYPGGQTCLWQTTIIPAPVKHSGSGQDVSVLNYQGTGWAFSLKLPNGTAAVQGPQFSDFTLDSEHGTSATNSGCFQFNSPLNGFTDDASSQEYMFQARVERVTCVMNATSTGGVGVQTSKVFDGVFDSNHIEYGTTGISTYGSDAVEASNNALYYADMQEILCTGENTFGNYDRFDHNDMPSVQDATPNGFVNTSCRTDYITENHLENDSSTIPQAILITGGINHTIRDNNVDGAYTNWLTVNAILNVLVLENNVSVAGTEYSANFNSGTGTPYYYNGAGVRQLIRAWGNQDLDVGIPFNSVAGNVSTPVATLPVSATGQTVWVFNPNLVGLSDIGYGQTVNVLNQTWILPGSGSNDTLTFAGPTPPASAMDIYVCGYYTGANAQTIKINDGTSNGTVTLPTTATYNICQVAISNDTNTPTGFTAENTTATAGTAHIAQIIAVVH